MDDPRPKQSRPGETFVLASATAAFQDGADPCPQFTGWGDVFPQHHVLLGLVIVLGVYELKNVDFLNDVFVRAEERFDGGNGQQR